MFFSAAGVENEQKKKGEKRVNPPERGGRRRSSSAFLLPFFVFLLFRPFRPFFSRPVSGDGFPRYYAARKMNPSEARRRGGRVYTTSTAAGTSIGRERITSTSIGRVRNNIIIHPVSDARAVGCSSA